MSVAVLKITDGTTTIDLLERLSGFHLSSWTPATPEYKDGGLFQSSPFSDGRRMIMKQFDNAVEEFDLKLRAASQDDVIVHMRTLRNLLEKASNYWTTAWQKEPVWIEAKANNETNIRYAVIMAGRIHEDSNPFSQPFIQPMKTAVMDDLQLVLERGPWLSDQPGTGTCVEVSGTQTYPQATAGGTTTDTPTASSDDATGRYGDAGGGTFSITSVSGFLGWPLGGPVSPAFNGIRFRSVLLPVNSTIISARIDFTASGTSTPGNGNVKVVIMGDTDTTPAAFSTYSEYFSKVRTNARVYWPSPYASAIFPDWTSGVVYSSPDISPIIQEIIDGAGWASGNDLTILIEDFASTASHARNFAANDHASLADPQLIVSYQGAEVTYGREATCTQEVYFSTRRQMNNITHAFRFDASLASYSGNLIGGGVPYNIFPSTPGNGDILYVGIQSSLQNSGPFSNLIFDLESILSYSADADLLMEYWNGASWSLVVPTNHTASDPHSTDQYFKKLGVGSVTWVPDASWATKAENGVTAYWVRFRMVFNAGAILGSCRQQNRDIYTCVWPRVDIDQSTVESDLPLLVQLDIINDSDQHLNLSPNLQSNRLVIGLRSLDRGEDFEAYINMSDEQNHGDIQVNLSHLQSSFASDTRAPSGRKLRVTAGVATLAEVCRIDFGGEISQHYFGKYHAYARVERTGGTAAGTGLQLYQTFAAIDTPSSEVKYILETRDFHLVDFGVIDIPIWLETKTSDELTNFALKLYLVSDASTLDIFDLILIPIDEWVCDTQNETTTTEASLGSGLTRRRIEIDSVTFPKINLRAVTRDVSTAGYTVFPNEKLWAGWRVSSSGPAILQPRSDQRLWFLSESYFTEGSIPDISLPETLFSIKVIGQRRYLSMRGDE
jgi:hypothetical protein